MKGAAAVRALLGLVLVVLAVGCCLLYVVSLDLAQSYPELAYLRLPVYLGVVVGLVPVVIGLVGVWAFLGGAGRRDVLPHQAVQPLLRRLMILSPVVVGYYTVGLVGFGALTGLMHAFLLIAWFVVAVIAALVFAVAALLLRLAETSDSSRRKHELFV